MNNYSPQNLSVIVSVLFSGLLAGLFYGYACSVNLGLGCLPDPEYLKAMQFINKSILNPAFFASFFGSLLMLSFAAWLNYTRDGSIRHYLLFFAAIINAIGVFGVTVMGNVPLNEALAKFNVGAASITEIALQREHFEIPWNRYHLIRTGASILSFLLSILSVFKIK